jgi:flagellum-specific ATP synthase
VAPAVATPEQHSAGGDVRELLAAWRDSRDLIEIDAYVRGTNPVVDRALALKPAIDAYCKQSMNERSDLNTARDGLVALLSAPGNHA